jgi:hypothetical protein
MARRDAKGIKLSTNIWVQDISNHWHLMRSGKPAGWYDLQDLFQGKVEMDQVALLSTNWEGVNPTTGRHWELKIKEALKYDRQKGLVFIELPRLNSIEAWWVLEGLVELRVAELGRRVNEVMRIEWESKRAVEARERFKTAKEREEEERKNAKGDRVELDKAEGRKFFRIKLERAYTRLRIFLELISVRDAEEDKET